jgi:hypothetical protein
MKSKKRRSRWKTVACAAVLSVSASHAATDGGYAGPILTPNALDFGNVLVDTSSAALTVSVEADYGGRIASGASLSITSITLPANYSRSGGTCPASGAAPNPCTIGVVFTPSDVGVQAGTGVISATVNGLPGSSNLAVTGTGVPGEVSSVPGLGSLGLLALLAAMLGSGAYFASRR